MITKQSYLRDFLKGEADLGSPYAKWAWEHRPLESVTLTPKGRRLNNFCVGSDPEFALMERYVGVDTVEYGARIDAYSAGLRVGLAAGCDQNERLVELRPAPSVSVVEHVAGILTALRWMYRAYPSVRNRGWRAGAFFSGDGLGGHVHFGRKRPTRSDEVAGLDGLARGFRDAQMFPNKEWSRRQQGDQLGQHYGAPGDFRIQKHGYEYRSLPSWLLSPEIAFICITASKLSVLDPSLTANWPVKMTPAIARNFLTVLAKYYKSRDDDALIMYHLLTQPEDRIFGQPYTRSFAESWGINHSKVLTQISNILPASIKPDATEVQEVLDCLVSRKGLSFRELPATFTNSLPRDYMWLPDHIRGGRRSGFGDLLHNLVTHIAAHINLDCTRGGSLVVAGSIPALWTAKEKMMAREWVPGIVFDAVPGGGNLISIPTSFMQTATIGDFRAFLLDTGLFPIWTVETVRPNSYLDWATGRQEKPNSKPGWRSV